MASHPDIRRTPRDVIGEGPGALGCVDGIGKPPEETKGTPTFSTKCGLKVDEGATAKGRTVFLNQVTEIRFRLVQLATERDDTDWVIFLFPVLAGRFAPTVPGLISFLAITLTLRFTDNPKIHAASAIFIWLLLMIFVAVFAMQLGAVAEAVKSGA